MDRIIKFRVWDKLSNKLFPWRIDVNHYLKNDGTCFKDFVLQQFTGLQDKNGKDIFEGDILKMSGDYVGMVKFVQHESPSYDGAWQVEYAKWVLVKCKEQGYINSYHLSAKEYREIIGNIFENPDLIK